MFDIRRAIDGISLEIKRIGLEINPAKCSLMLNNFQPNKEVDTTAYGIYVNRIPTAAPADYHPKVIPCHPRICEERKGDHPKRFIQSTGPRNVNEIFQDNKLTINKETKM